MATLFNNYSSSVFTSEDTTNIPTTYPSSDLPIIYSIGVTSEVALRLRDTERLSNKNLLRN